MDITVLYIALKIAVTNPGSSASSERSFSKLKILKNRLRTSMSNSRLENLLLIACEHDVEINYETVIELLAEKSSLFRDLLFTSIVNVMVASAGLSSSEVFCIPERAS